MTYAKLTLHPDRDLWDRQPGETPTAYSRFLEYRDLRPSERTYAQVAESSGKSARTIKQMGAAHRWRDRAAAWDAHADTQRRQRLAEQDEEMGRAVMQAARAATAVLLTSIRDIKDSGAPLEPKDVPRWVEAVERLRRIALDRPEQIVAITGPGTAHGPALEELANLTPEERRARIRQTTERLVRAVNEQGA